MSTIEKTNNTTLAQPRQAVAPQSQSPGSWYNPLPNPYLYGIPNNGGNFYGGFGGMYPGGFQGAYPYNYGGFPGGFNTAQMGGNMWGGYNFQNNNPNGALPGYGYNSVIAPTHFQTPLSGDGTEPLYSGTAIYQKAFEYANAPLINMGTLAGGALLGGAIWSATAGKIIPGLKRGKIARLVGFGMAVISGLGAVWIAAPTITKEAKSSYSGKDHADNGIVDGSYATQRNNDLSLLNMWRSGR